jgi:hypothetical protein
MSIVRTNKKYVPTCDICGDTLPAELDYYDAVYNKREEGWKSNQRNGEWIDICCNCQQEGNTKRNGF